MGRVKGVLFVDYVRMLRAHRNRSWNQHVLPEDEPFLEQTVDPAAWYPMATFERLGLAILDTIAEGDLDLVRLWGRASAAHVAGTVEDVVVPEDPRESLMRFFVLRQSFFDFEALSMLELSDGSAALQIQYGMSPLAEQAAAVQTLGFFEGLVELADGVSIKASLTERSWHGDARTVLSLSWQVPDATAGDTQGPPTRDPSQGSR
jgi:hypothetical protein